MTSTSDNQQDNQLQGHSASPRPRTFFGAIGGCLALAGGGGLALFFLLNWVTSESMAAAGDIFIYPVAVVAHACIAHGRAAFSFLAATGALSLCVLNKSADESFSSLPGAKRIGSIFNRVLPVTGISMFFFGAAWFVFFVCSAEMTPQSLAAAAAATHEDANAYSWTVDTLAKPATVSSFSGFVKPAAFAVDASDGTVRLGFSLSFNIDDCNAVMKDARLTHESYRLVSVNDKPVGAGACSNTFYNKATFVTPYVLRSAHKAGGARATDGAGGQTDRGKQPATVARP